jgi:hypothetical protein
LSQIALVETEGTAVKVGNGFVDEPSRLPLPGMFEPANVDLDFWRVLV